MDISGYSRPFLLLCLLLNCLPQCESNQANVLALVDFLV